MLELSMLIMKHTQALGIQPSYLMDRIMENI